MNRILVIISPVSLQERSDIRWGTGKKSEKFCRANGRIRESFHWQGRKAGEASAITLAWPFRDFSLLVLDEKRGRKVASALGLLITGTAGLSTDAAAAGLVDFEDVFSLPSHKKAKNECLAWIILISSGSVGLDFLKWVKNFNTCLLVVA